MASDFKSKIYKFMKWGGVAMATFLVLLYLIPLIFQDKIAGEVKTLANRKLNGELNFKEAELTFFRHFPSLTVTLSDFSLKGSPPFQKETLVSANEISLGINIKSLVFDNAVAIDEIYLSQALFNVKVNTKGEANYNVYVSESKAKEKDTTSTTAIRLEKIVIKKCRLVYDDKSTDILIKAKDFNYQGTGDLDKAIFDLHTDAQIAAFDLTYAGQNYFFNKSVNAKLVTQINTDKLSFIFQKNDLKINELPVEFKGRFDFLNDGYDMDFMVRSEKSQLRDFFTALPPQYISWVKKTEIKGETDFIITLKGKYVESQYLNPDLMMNMKIRNGYVNYQGAPVAASNIFLNFDTRLPSLNPELLKVNIDSVFFNVGKDYAKAIIKTEGMSKPKIAARFQSKIDLAQMGRAFGMKDLILKGILKSDMYATGLYDPKNGKIPVTQGQISLKGGYVKTPYYPNPIENINLLALVTDKAGTMQDLKIQITPASLVFEGKPIYVNAQVENFEDIAYDIKARGELDVAKIYKVFSQKGLDLEGYVKADVSFKGTQSDAAAGRYDKLQNSGTLILRNIKTTSEYLPKPFIIKEGTFAFHQDKMNFKDFIGAYGQSDFKMSGYLQNVIDFVLTQNAVLKGNFSLNSDYINVDEFMFNAEGNAAESKESPSGGDVASQTIDTTAVETASGSGVVIIPPNLDLQFRAIAKKIDFEDLKIENLNGQMNIKNGQLQLKNSGFDLVGCKVNTDLVYGSQTPQKAFFNFKIKAKDFDVKRAYNEVKMFREMASAAENAEGIISLDYKVTGILNENMEPIYPSLTGGGVLSVKQVKMQGYKLFGAVSRKTGKDEMKNPDLSEVNIKSSIKSNIITVEQFKFKVAGFRPRIEGTTSFDGDLNLKMRLGLPPFGLIGIPIKITGTQENPIVKVGKQTEDLKEVEYDGEVPSAL